MLMRLLLILCMSIVFGSLQAEEKCDKKLSEISEKIKTSDAKVQSWKKKFKEITRMKNSLKRKTLNGVKCNKYSQTKKQCENLKKGRRQSCECYATWIKTNLNYLYKKLSWDFKISRKNRKLAMDYIIGNLGEPKLCVDKTLEAKDKCKVSTLKEKVAEDTKEEKTEEKTDDKKEKVADDKKDKVVKEKKENKTEEKKDKVADEKREKQMDALNQKLTQMYEYLQKMMEQQKEFLTKLEERMTAPAPVQNPGYNNYHLYNHNAFGVPRTDTFYNRYLMGLGYIPRGPASYGIGSHFKIGEYLMGPPLSGQGNTRSKIGYFRF